MVEAWRPAARKGAFLARASKARTRTTPDSNRRRLEPLIERYLRECFERRVVARADELAAFLNANRRHLSHLVIEAFGKRLTVVLRERQLAYATELLIATNLEVADIVALTAFGHKSTFFRNFVRKYGETPTMYRLKNRPNATRLSGVRPI